MVRVRKLGEVVGAARGGEREAQSMHCRRERGIVGERGGGGKSYGKSKPVRKGGEKEGGADAQVPLARRIGAKRALFCRIFPFAAAEILFPHRGARQGRGGALPCSCCHQPLQKKQARGGVRFGFSGHPNPWPALAEQRWMAALGGSAGWRRLDNRTPHRVVAADAQPSEAHTLRPEPRTWHVQTSLRCARLPLRPYIGMPPS